MIGWLEENRKFSFIFLLIIAIEIFLFSSMPGSLQPGKGGIDLSSAYHLIAFFLFGFFLFVSMTGKEKITSKTLIPVIFISILYAVLDEIHQFFVPMRIPDLQDLLVDCAGIFLSTLVYFYYKRKS